jgi:hypothetical protein
LFAHLGIVDEWICGDIADTGLPTKRPGLQLYAKCQRRRPSSPVPIATARIIGHQPRRVPIWTSRASFFTDAGLFVLGAAGAFSVNLVGALPGDEVLLLPILPVLLLARGKRAFKPQYFWFYALSAAWLLGTLIADLHAGTPLPSRMKGTARVVFFALDFTILAILINDKSRRMIIFVLSIVAVMFSYVWQFRGDFALQWKFGGSSCLIMLSLLASSYYYSKGRYRVCLGISVVLAGLNLVYAFRSQMAIVLVSAVLTLPIFAQNRGTHSGRISPGGNPFKLVLMLILSVGSAYVANQAIIFAATHGYFEESTAEKFETQSKGKLGVLFGGRPETLVAIIAIRDSPIIGHGSFPASPVIPTHSHLTMAWVESGILGGLLWIYILLLTIRAIFRVAVLRPNLAPIYCYLLVNFVWDILYSPLGSVNRLWGAYLVLLSYDLLRAPKVENRPASIVRRVRYYPPRRIVGKRYFTP